MSDELSGLLLALGIFSVGFVSIGPNILAIIGTSMQRGRQDGTRLALGVGSGSAIWATLTVGGLTSLINAYAEAIVLLKIFGALYLLWLAWKAFRSAVRTDSNVQLEAASGRNLFAHGLLIQMTNPKAALQWIAIVGLGLGADAPLWVGMTLIATTTFLSVSVHVLYAVTFSTRPVIAVYRRARRWIEGFLGLFFSFAAFKIATYES